MKKKVERGEKRIQENLREVCESPSVCWGSFEPNVHVWESISIKTRFRTREGFSSLEMSERDDRSVDLKDDQESGRANNRSTAYGSSSRAIPPSAIENRTRDPRDIAAVMGDVWPYLSLRSFQISDGFVVSFGHLRTSTSYNWTLQCFLPLLLSMYLLGSSWSRYLFAGWMGEPLRL